MIVRIDSRLERIVPKFLESQRRQIPQLKLAYQRGDFGSLERLGHQNKGTCGGYGFTFLSELGALLEKAAQNKDDRKIEKAITEIEDYLEIVTVQYE